MRKVTDWMSDFGLAQQFDSFDKPNGNAAKSFPSVFIGSRNVDIPSQFLSSRRGLLPFLHREPRARALVITHEEVTSGHQ